MDAVDRRPHRSPPTVAETERIAASRASLLRPALTSAVIAAAITAVSGLAAVALARRYFSQTTYYYDSAQYRYVAVLVRRTLDADGLRAALGEALRLKDGLDVVLRVLLWPATLSNRFGHMAVALPLMAAFVFLVTWYVNVRTGSLLRGGLTAATVLTAGLVYGPYAGIADYWKDGIACWLLGSACLAWLLADRLRSARWSFIAGLCLGLLLLQRTAAAIYAAPAFLVPFVVAARLRIRADGWSRGCRGLVAFALPAAAAFLVLAVFQLRALFVYYRDFGYGYGSPRFIALTLAGNLRSLGGVAVFAVPALCAVCAVGVRDWRVRRSDVLTSAWLAAGFTATIVLTGGAYIPGYYACWTVLAVVVLATLMPSDARPTGGRLLAGVLLLVVAGGSALQLVRAASAATKGETVREGGDFRAAESARALRAFQWNVARILLAQPEPRVFKLLYSETGAEFWNLAYFDVDPAGALTLRESSAFFSVHDSYYRATFGANATAADVVREDVERLEEVPGTVVVVHCVPNEVLNQYWLIPDPRNEFQKNGNPLAAEIAIGLNERVSHSPDWKSIGRLESPLGCVDVRRYTPKVESTRSRFSE